MRSSTSRTAISRANRRYEELLDGINAYVFETDFNSGEMLYMNVRTRQIIGPTARSDQALLDHVHPEDRHLAIETALRARETGQPVTTEVRVLEFANRCAVVLSSPWKDRGVTIHPRVSIGIAVTHGTETEGETLLRQADTAMYECKRTWADHVVYDAALERLNIERLALLRDDAVSTPMRSRIGDRFPSDLQAGDLAAEEIVEEPK